MTSTSDNRRIAKNTIYLYIRTIVVLIVSLYTSRVVLQVLGAEDLGIYNVVGGIVALMSFLQAAQTKATSRFITYELGKRSSEEKLQKVFSVCMTIHVGIALIGFILSETVGLCIITNWTDIPVERQTAAMWAYQFAIIVFCIQLIRVPYDAVVVAHERMSMFAYMSILEAVLQLGIVVLLKTASGDSLIYYAASVAFVALVVCLCYYVYVRVKFQSYVFKPVWDKEYSKSVLSFSGWTLLGSSANTATQQGTNLLMNNFVGLVANAALGFAGQVNIAVSKFVNGFSTAFTPQVIKLYAQKDYIALHALITRASKYSFALCYLMALPLIVNMQFILTLWLGDNVPMYTKEFCQLILVCTIVDATTGVYNTTITATGHIKKYQMAISLSFFLDLACCSILLLCQINPVLVFSSRILTRGLINMGIGLHYIKKYVSFSVPVYINEVIVKIGYTILLTALPVYWVFCETNGWPRLISTSLLSFVLISGCVYALIMTRSERTSIMNKLKSRF